MRIPTTAALLLIACSGFAQKSDTTAMRRVQVFGAVTDATTGKPVYDCTVEHYDLNGKRWSLTQVNSDGRYAMFVPTGKAFELRIERENGYVDLQQRIEAIPEGTRTFEADLRISPK